MTFHQLKSRRDFLRYGCRTLSTIGAAAAFGQAGLVSANAQSSGGDYKALVCIFLFGGNDANNMLIPNDSNSYANYANYKTVRQNLAIPQASLVSIHDALSNSNFGLHPSMSALSPLYSSGSGATAVKRLALIANVGTLVGPTTRATLNSTKLPVNLFSHSDQQSEWQNAVPQGGATTGWEGRMIDKMFPGITPSFPPAIGVSGNSLQLIGSNSSTTPTAVNLSGFSLQASATDPGSTALQQMLNLSSGVTLVQAAQNSLKDAVAIAQAIDQAVAGAGSLGVTFQNTDIGTQLNQVAKIIQVRAALGATRQVFFCSQGGFDTHSDELAQQSTLLGNLANAMATFDTAMGNIGAQSNVATFTESEFSRTFQPNGNAGTDHAWGSHHLILGGPVQGGQIYGKFPQQVLSGPDDSGDRGNWVPTTSTDQYGAALAKWFGVTAQADLNYVFPNLVNFGYAAPTILGV